MTRIVIVLRENKIQGIKLWREAFRIVDDVFLPKHCRIKYEAVKQLVFKNVEINYEAVRSSVVSIYFLVSYVWCHVRLGCVWIIKRGNQVLLVFWVSIRRNSAIRLFLVLSEMNDMYFSPILPGMILMLMNYISEEEVYIVFLFLVFCSPQTISSILENVELYQKYLILNQRYEEAFIENLCTINRRCITLPFVFHASC